MPPLTYRARPRSPLDVEADLCRLWRDNLPLATSAEDKFRWLYRDAPDAADTVFVLEAVEADQAHVVGANGMVRRRFWLAGRELRAVVNCDFAVDRAHRSLLPALSLLRMFREDVAARFDLAYGFPNGKAEGVLKRAGFKELGPHQALGQGASPRQLCHAPELASGCASRRAHRRFASLASACWRRHRRRRESRGGQPRRGARGQEVPGAVARCARRAVGRAVGRGSG